jgi:hypothetical protein
MKKYICFCIVASSPFLIGHAYSQNKVLAYSISIQASAQVHYYQSSPTGGHDPNWPNDTIEVQNLGESLLRQDTVIQSGDTMTIKWGFNIGGSGEQHIESDEIQLVLDTLNKRADFSYSTWYDVVNFDQGSLEVKDFFFQSLDYQTMGDTIIFINADSKKLLKGHVKSIDYSYTQTVKTFDSVHHTQYINDDKQLVNVDSNTLNLSIALISVKPINNVHSEMSFNNSLIASISFTHTIHFSFPSSNNSQQMSIYDILGREISRIEIPAGSSSYQMSSVGYPRGTFFARLGLQTASFMVN